MLFDIMLMLLALFCLFYCYVIFLFSQVNVEDEVEIGVSATELESDLHAGLHLYGRDG